MSNGHYPSISELRRLITQRKAYHLLRERPGVAYRKMAHADALRNRNLQYSEPVREVSYGRSAPHGNVSENTDVSTSASRLRRLQGALRRRS